MASEAGRMSVAVSAEIQRKLDIIAAGEDRSRNWIVNQAISHYVELYEWQIKRIEERLERAKNPDAVFYSGKDVDDMIGTFKS